MKHPPASRRLVVAQLGSLGLLAASGNRLHAQDFSKVDIRAEQLSPSVCAVWLGRQHWLVGGCEGVRNFVCEA